MTELCPWVWCLPFFGTRCSCMRLVEFRVIPIIPVVYRQSWVVTVSVSCHCSRQQCIWWKR